MIILVLVRTERHDSAGDALDSGRAPSSADVGARRAALAAEVRGRHGDDRRVVPHDVLGAEGEDDGVVALLPESLRLGVGAEVGLAFDLGDVAGLE